MVTAESFMKLSRTHLIAIALSLGFLSIVPCTAAQNPHLRPRPLPVTVDADNSEEWKTEISYLSQSIGPDEPVILIARLGNRETSRRLSRQRLEVARFALHVSRGLEPELKEENIVTAEGERVRGAGRIEAYVRGRLFMVFLFGRNKNFAPEA